jgi:hypothetical protein
MARRLSEETEKSNVTPDLIAEALASHTKKKGILARAAMSVAHDQKRYEKQGVDPKLIRKLFREQDLSEEKRAYEYAEELRYRRAVNLIEWESSGQGNFLKAVEGLPSVEPDSAAAMGLAEARAFNDGYNSFKAGGATAFNKYTLGSPEHAAFVRGNRDAQQEAGTTNGAAKPGRKPKAEAAAAPAPKVEDNSDLAREPKPTKGRGRPPGSKNKVPAATAKEGLLN